MKLNGFSPFSFRDANIPPHILIWFVSAILLTVAVQVSLKTTWQMV
jgi:hypothetical protein